MSRNKLLFLIISLILISTGCTVVEGEVKDRIVPPDNNNIPISGRWEATYVYDEGFIAIDDEATFEERNIEALTLEAFFHREGVVVGEKFTENPSFRIKNVLAYNYLSKNFRLTPSDIEIENERIEVITVLNEGTYLVDFVRMNEEMILTRYNDVFYIFERLTEEASVAELERYIEIQKDVLKTLESDEEQNLQTGFLLGLKIPSYDEISNNVDWDYKTIWINTANGQVSNIYEVDKLLLPRKNGFWEVEKERSYTGQSVRDRIRVIPLFRAEDEDSPNRGTASIDALVDILNEGEKDSTLKNILFIGNDYISVENIDLDNNEKRTLEINAIDNIREETPIKLSDLIGEDGRELFTEGARTEMPLDNNIVPNEGNIGLFRKDGHWSLRGRINYFQSGEELYRDFNIRAIPPTSMVSFDDQFVPYSMVNIAVPGLVDYFSSPNEEFIVALTGRQLTVYPVENGQLVYTPSARFTIPNDASVIMSEWARGRYTETWEQEIIENGGVEVEY